MREDGWIGHRVGVIFLPHNHQEELLPMFRLVDT